MISFALDDDQQLVQETVHKFARDVLRKGTRQFEREGVPAEVEAAFWELGLIQAELEEGLPQVTAALIHEELSWGDPGAAVALWSPHLLTLALRELGTKEQQERLLDPFRRARPGPGVPLPRGALAYSERWQRRLAGFATAAVPTLAGYSLSGTKSFVINAAEAQLTLVLCQLNLDAGWDGIGVFAITGRPVEDPSASFRLGDRHELLGLRALRSGELCLEDHFVPEENRLREGSDPDLCAAVLRLLARAQLMNAARQVGLARAAYELALEYTQERHAFGKPIAHFQAIAFTLADMAMDVDSARWLLWRAAAAADAGALDLSLCAEAAVHANEAAFRAADSCVQLLGGAGYVEDFPAEKWLREAKALGLLGGTDQLHAQLIAAESLGQSAEVDAGPGRDGRAGRHGLPSSSLQPFFT